MYNVEYEQGIPSFAVYVESEDEGKYIYATEE